MRDTMRAQNGAGLAAPQIGVGLRVVIFGVDGNPRYPDAEPVPYTELINPVITPLSDEVEDGLGGLPVGPGHARRRARALRIRYRGFDPRGHVVERDATASMRASSSTNATTSTASSIRCASAISRDSASPTCCSPTLADAADD